MEWQLSLHLRPSYTNIKSLKPWCLWWCRPDKRHRYISCGLWRFNLHLATWKE